MTAFTTISNSLVAVGAKPFATTIQALRDNPIAIAEADSSVALGLLPTVLLGTATPSGVASSTISGLVLTPYKFLVIDFSLSPGTSSVNLLLAGVTFATGLVAGLDQQGLAFISLATGRYGGTFGGNAQGANGGTTSITNASTSFSMSMSAGVMTGSFRLFGMK